MTVPARVLLGVVSVALIAVGVLAVIRAPGQDRYEQQIVGVVRAQTQARAEHGRFLPVEQLRRQYQTLLSAGLPDGVTVTVTGDTYVLHDPARRADLVAVFSADGAARCTGSALCAQMLLAAR